MAEWRKFAAKQKTKRRGKNQVVEDNKVAEEIVVQRMSGDVSGKQQKYSRIGASECVPFEQDELSIRNTKDACQKHFGPQIEKDLVCDVLRRSLLRILFMIVVRYVNESVTARF